MIKLWLKLLTVRIEAVILQTVQKFLESKLKMFTKLTKNQSEVPSVIDRQSCHPLP